MATPRTEIFKHFDGGYEARVNFDLAALHVNERLARDLPRLVTDVLVEQVANDIYEAMGSGELDKREFVGCVVDKAAERLAEMLLERV